MPAPAKKATAYTFFVGLVDQANTKLLKANPTLAAGDVKISKDGGAFSNLATLPTVTPASGAAVRSLSSTEMNADNVVVLFSDAAGAEWCDQLISINTSSKTLDDALAHQRRVQEEHRGDAALRDDGRHHARAHRWRHGDGAAFH